MDPRVTTLEMDITSTRARLDALESTCASCVALVALEGRIDLKIASSTHELERKIESSKHDLERKIDSAQHDLEKKIDAIHAELQRQIALNAQQLALMVSKNNTVTRNWFLATALSMFVAMGSFANALYRLVPA